MSDARELGAEALYKRCDPEAFTFETTAELEDLEEALGQPRAVDAVRFGVGIRSEGYNIYALGPAGTGKHDLVKRFVEEQGAAEPVPSDWVYVNDFTLPSQPRVLQLPAGTGDRLRRDMDEFVERLRPALAAAFRSDEYQTGRQVIEEEFKERSEAAFSDLQRMAQEREFALLRTPVGWTLAPQRDGELLAPEELEKLPDDERRRLEAHGEALQEELQKVLRQIPRLEQERQVRIRALNQEVARFTVGLLVNELRTRYASLPAVVEHLNAVQTDVVENAHNLLDLERSPVNTSTEDPATPLLRRYRANVLVDNGDSKGAPVIYEDNPTYQNLVGRVEYISQMGTLVTDFNLIRPGALHRANGGYLLLDARKVLAEPYAWEGLKRALRAGQIRIESLGQMLALMSTVSLEPEPVPLDIKVILIGDRLLYYLLCELDPDFGELFKVEADFDDQTDRSPENEALYARLIATISRKERLRPFGRDAVARVIEHLSRIAGDSEKLSTRVRETSDLLRESDYWAKENGNGVVGAADVQRAIDAWIYRSERLRQRLREETLRDTILVDTDGARVGQVNGLSVRQLGNFSFGHPSRITARVRFGSKGEVVDIEREVELGGPIHSKGVLILASFLGARYAAERPLSLSASLVFEQSYGGVEGDSASSAELYALLSAIAEIPLRQSVAVTGSVNQHGRVQAIGGVNEKVEGFFDLCQARGLTGDQGVIIPSSNTKHLMLRRDVVEAVSDGAFHVYSVENVDEGIEILSGLSAGERDVHGNYPEGSVNGRVQTRLTELTEKQMQFSRLAREE